MHGFPFVSLGLIVANLLAFVTVRDVGEYGLVPARVEVAALVSSMFMHVDLVHVAGNTTALLLVGNLVERYLGHARLAALYFAGGASGGLLYAFVEPAGATLVGASARVYGLMAAAAMARPCAALLVVPLGLVNVVALFVRSPLLVPPGTAVAAHVGGLAGGYVLARALFTRAIFDARRRVARA